MFVRLSNKSTAPASIFYSLVLKSDYTKKNTAVITIDLKLWSK